VYYWCVAAKKAPTIDEHWYARLDDAWKKVFADQCEIDSPAKAKKLAAVTELYIDDEAEVSSLAPVAKLEKIREINCDAKKVTDLSPLTALPKLELLRISSPIVDFSPIARMTALKALDLSDAAISDLAPLAGLAKLERLDLSGTAISDLSPIARLKKIERLEIARTKVRDLSPVLGWKKLDDLGIAGCPIESFDVLAKIPKLGRLDVSDTAIASLEPIYGRKGLYILLVQNTKVSLADILRAKQSLSDSLIGLDVYCDYRKHDAFLAALDGLDPKGVEEALTSWMNDVLLAMIKDEDHTHLAPNLLEKWFELRVLPNKYTREIAGNALIAIMKEVDPALERAVLGDLVPQAEMDRRLAFNLACYHARRGHRQDALRHAKIALEMGQEAERFRTDADFDALRGDADFVALVSARHSPDPYASPLAWWKSLPEDLRRSFYAGDESEDAIRDALAKPLELQLDSVRSMDPLRGLRVKRLLNRRCKATSLEIAATFQGLEILDWEKREHGEGTQLTSLAPLANVTSLRVLRIAGHLFADLGPLAALVNLEELNVRGSPIASIDALRGLAKLTYLAIDAAAPLDLSAFEGLSALEQLWLMGPVKSFEPVAKLPSLRRLWMQKLTLADGSPVPLAPLYGLTKLEQIWVASDRVGEAKKELKKRLPACKVS